VGSAPKVRKRPQAVIKIDAAHYAIEWIWPKEIEVDGSSVPIPERQRRATSKVKFVHLFELG
jgi:hypothetical protein